MQINSDYYGTGRETLLNDIETTDYTIIGAINSGDLPKNKQFDLSICPWRIGGGSDIFDLRFPIISTTSPVSADGVWDIGEHRVFKDHENGYPFYFCYNSNGWRVKSLWFDGRSKDITTPEIPTSYAQLRNDNKIITNFDYSKLCVGVKFYTNYGYIDIGTLEYYFNPETYDPNGVFQVYGIAPIFYYWNGTNFSSPEIGLACLSKGAACGSLNPNAQYYDDEWFDSCINVCTNYFSIGSGVDRVQRYGTRGGVHDGTEWINPYKVYDMIFTSAVNTPQTDFNNRPLLFQGGEHWQMKVSNYAAYDGWSTSINIRPRLKLEDFETFADLKNYILTQLAFIGCYFVESEAPSTSDYPLKDNANVYLAEITDGEQAITTGNYKKGLEQRQYHNSDWTLDPWSVTPDPSYTQDDPNTYDDNTTVLNANGNYIYQDFTTQYALSPLELSHVASALFTKISTDTDSDYFSSKELFVNNPLDCVLNLKFFPFDIASMQSDPNGNTYKNVTFGAFDTNVNALVNRETVITVDFGKILYYPILGADDFRSYPPYSNATLCIPFCGSVDIDPNTFLNHYIGVKMLIDTTTGSCLALIYCDNMVIDSISGSVGVDFTISGIQSATLSAAQRQSETQLKTAKNSQTLGFAKSAIGVTGGIALTMANPVAGILTTAGGLISGASAAMQSDNIEQSEYNLEHVAIPYKTIGTASAATSWANELQCRLIIHLPEMLTGYNAPEKIAEYAHTTGFKTMENGLIGDYSGYTEITAANLDGINCTSAEKKKIFDLLKGGVIL